MVLHLGKHRFEDESSWICSTIFNEHLKSSTVVHSGIASEKVEIAEQLTGHDFEVSCAIFCSKQ